MSKLRLLLLVHILVTIIIGLLFGWLVSMIFFHVVIAFAYIHFSIWRKKSLLTALVEFEGNKVSFECIKHPTSDGSVFYQSVESHVIAENNVWLTALRVAKTDILPEGDFEIKGNTVSSKLSLSKEIELTFLMDKEWSRCPCGLIPPCWEGEEYSAQFIHTENGINWIVGISLIKVHPRYYRRKGRKILHQHEERVIDEGMKPVFN